MIVKNLVIPMIITFILIIAYVVTFTILFKNADRNKKLLPVRILFFILIGLEVLKIFYLIAKDGYYYANRFPIVFCSMVMYAWPLFCFKKNKFSDVAMSFSVIPSILAFLMFAAIQYKYNMSLIQVHSYIYHGSMLAVAIYLITSKLYTFEFKKFFPLSLAVGGYLLTASIISMLIGGPISVFAPTDPYLAFLYNVDGFMVGICAMIIAEYIACFAVYGIIDLCKKSRKKKQEKIESQNNNEGETQNV